MQKTILLTGSTDGIGLETARMLVELGHRVLLHGRSAAKLEKTAEQLSAKSGPGTVESYLADLSVMADVERLADDVRARHERIDVLINNAGVFKAPETVTADGLDIRFAVNTIAPYLLTRQLMPLLGPNGRIVNLSSAGQSPVDLDALDGRVRIADDYTTYAQSKLAITMWSRELALDLGADGPLVVAVNPGSLLGSKMVQEGFGVAGGDIRIGADILVRAALSDEFASASGRYFDNDARRFADPHPDALDRQKSGAVVNAIEKILSGI